ncbi:VapB protein (antitoxin to VapC) [Burkholderia cenocepacia KC-01]|nr:VapB protein (antitoxin to VapC) [Burkholderia cenocepacia KC-01]
MRDILEQAVRPGGRPRLGTLLAEIGREAGGIDFEVRRDASSTDPMSFE